MSGSEHCPICGAASTFGSFAQDNYCSDACALRSSDRLWSILEEEITRLAPNMSRESFADAMSSFAEDLDLRVEKRLRPVAKAVDRSFIARHAQAVDAESITS